MRFVKLSLLLLVLCTNNAFAKGAGAGKYRNWGINYDCKPGCYCIASSNPVNWAAGDVEKGCKNRWGKITTSLSTKNKGVHLCPTPYTESASGAKAITDCYYKLGEDKIYYGTTQPITCGAGKYLPAGKRTAKDCTTCPKDHYCEGITNVYPAESNQGIVKCADHQTTNNQEGSSVSTHCQSKRCPAGKYFPANSLNCATCLASHYCPNETIYDISKKTTNQGLTPCPAGTTHSEQGSKEKTDCEKIKVTETECSPGDYLKEGSCQPCPAGQYCTGGTDGPTDCPAGKYRSETGAKAETDCKECDAAHFCPAGTSEPKLCPGTTKEEKNSGGYKVSDKKFWKANSEFPDNAYTNEGFEITNAYLPTWDSTKGKGKAADCIIVYHFKNKRSNLGVQESVSYDEDSKTYNQKGGTVYYGTVNKGYYLEKQYQNDYCEKNPDSYMIYQHVLPCEPGKYCPGIDNRYKCAIGKYADTLGMRDVPQVSCDSDKYLPADSETCTTCKSGHTCPGGTFTMSTTPQGIYKPYNQAKLQECWENVEAIGFKDCVFNGKKD